MCALGLTHRVGPDTVEEDLHLRYDLTVTTTGFDEVVCHIGWTVRDTSGDVIAIGTWMGTKLEVYTPLGALREAFDQAQAMAFEQSALPLDGEF